MNKNKVKPPMAIDKNSKFIYKSGADVLATWKKYGWTPPSEGKSNANTNNNN